MFSCDDVDVERQKKRKREREHFIRVEHRKCIHSFPRHITTESEPLPFWQCSPYMQRNVRSDRRFTGCSPMSFGGCLFRFLKHRTTQHRTLLSVFLTCSACFGQGEENNVCEYFTFHLNYFFVPGTVLLENSSNRSQLNCLMLCYCDHRKDARWFRGV